MKQQIIPKRGLSTNPSPFISEEPSFSTINNVYFDRAGIIKVRNGFKNDGTVLSSTPQKLLKYKDRAIAHHGSTLSYDSDGNRTFVDYTGSYTSQGLKLRSIEASGSMYFTSTDGIKKIDDLTNNPVASGIPRALSGTGVLNASVGGWFLEDNQVAYRLVWGRKDANKLVQLGFPSDRLILINPAASGNDNVTLTYDVPDGISSGYFYQLYRSNLSTSGTILPNDELFLVFEGNYTSGTSITIADITPYAVAGIACYTNPSQEGIENGNLEPPLSKDITFFKRVAIFSSTQQKQFLTFNLLGTGATGLALGKVITVTGSSSFSITAAVAENIAIGNFYLDTASTSVALQIENTAQSIVRVINGYASNTIINAYYASQFDEFPGKIALQGSSFGVSAFSLTSDAVSTAFNPVIPPSGTTLISDPDADESKIYISKANEVESVPVASYFQVGSRNFDTLRVIALRDSFFIFREDGIFRGTGDDASNISIIPFDQTVTLTGVETASVFNNTIFILSESGIARINDNGVAIITAGTIDDKITQLVKTSTNLDLAFGVGYEISRRYYLFYPSNNSLTYCDSAFVFSDTSQQFTTMEFNAYSGMVNDSGLFYLYSNDSVVYQERKGYNADDYQDKTISVNISVVTSSTSITLSSATGVVVNMYLTQGFTRALITSVVGNVLTLETNTSTWITGVAIASVPILVEMVYNPITMGDKSLDKQFQECEFLFGENDSHALSVGFATDLDSDFEDVTITSGSYADYGLSDYGSDVYGGSTSPYTANRTYVPRQKQWAHWITPRITNNDSLSALSYLGMSLTAEGISDVIPT